MQYAGITARRHASAHFAYRESLARRFAMVFILMMIFFALRSCV